MVNRSGTGPFDLAKQIGVQRGGEEHEAAIQRILKAAKSAGKKAAIFCMLRPILGLQNIYPDHRRYRRRGRAEPRSTGIRHGFHRH
jgi:hypothetical protein